MTSKYSHLVFYWYHNLLMIIAFFFFFTRLLKLWVISKWILCFSFSQQDYGNCVSHSQMIFPYFMLGHLISYVLIQTSASKVDKVENQVILSSSLCRTKHRNFSFPVKCASLQEEFREHCILFAYKAHLHSSCQSCNLVIPNTRKHVKTNSKEIHSNVNKKIITSTWKTQDHLCQWNSCSNPKPRTSIFLSASTVIWDQKRSQNVDIDY